MPVLIECEICHHASASAQGWISVTDRRKPLKRGTEHPTYLVDTLACLGSLAERLQEGEE